jgi:hypothetical protein
MSCCPGGGSSTWAAPDVRCFGVEPNPAYGQYALEGAVERIWKTLEEVPADEKFDLVIINHVLEHVRSPAGMLARLRALLTDEGAIYIDVPDASRYESLADLHIAHLYHFTVTSLRRVANRAGLDASILARHDPPHHPRSVRGLFAPRDNLALDVQPDPEADLVRTTIQRIARSAPMYFARRSWLGRIVIGVPQRLWRGLSIGRTGA